MGVEERLARLLSEQMGYPADRIRLDTRLSEDVGMAGDDADEFLEALVREFDVDFAGFEFERHFDSEAGCNPLAFFVRRKRCYPLTFGDVLDAVRAGRWEMKYED